VGSGKWSVQQFTDALNAKDRATALQMAPPQGLILTHVSYEPDTPNRAPSDRQRGDAPPNLTGE
jgi:tRNA U38,U39,U40 pseudouridine synthase TruA